MDLLDSFFYNNCDTKISSPVKLPKKGLELLQEMNFSEKEWDIYRNTIAKIESSGRYNIQGGYNDNYDGRYQLGLLAKKDASRILNLNPNILNNRAEFRQDPNKQELFFIAYTKANDEYLKKNTLKYSDFSPQKKLQVLGFAHNQGWKLAKDWIESKIDSRDSFGTPGSLFCDAIEQSFKNHLD